MPPHQTNLTAELERDAARLGRVIALTKNAMGNALAAARPSAAVAELRDAVSEKDAAAPPGAPAPSLFGLLARYWLAFREGGRRRRLRVSLCDLDERQLIDIGLTRADIEVIAAHRARERLRDNMAYQLMSQGVM
jgi:uncharacterized protein YjiS (DUF1127 family)